MSTECEEFFQTNAVPNDYEKNIKLVKNFIEEMQPNGTIVLVTVRI